VDEGALGRLHLRAGVVQRLAAPHDGAQGVLLGAVGPGLVQPRENTREHGRRIIPHVHEGNAGERRTAGRRMRPSPRGVFVQAFPCGNNMSSLNNVNSKAYSRH